MRIEDMSQSGSIGGSDQSPGLTANNDYDVIPAGASAPATGNAISGSGTVSGAAGADLLGTGQAHIVSITGAGGTDSTFTAGQLEVAGKFGVIRIDAQGNYTYTRNAGTPDGVTDVFTYSLADRAGAQDSAMLSIRIEAEPLDLANAQRVVPGADGVVTLPPGVSLADIRVIGRDLVIELPDGSLMVIVDGAVFVPQLVLGGVEVPSTNLAALLIDSEPQPAAGPAPQSSGGNFEVPLSPLDPGVPLGDLIPPTVLDYVPPEFEEPYIPEEDEDEPPVGAEPITLEVDDDALEGGNNSESGEEIDSDTLSFTAGTDALVDFAFSTDLSGLGGGLTWTRVSDTEIEGRDGGTLILTLTLTAPASIPGGASGGVTVTATLSDNYDSHPGINADDLVSLGSIVVVASESDGTSVTGTVNVGVSDDVPIATGAQAASGIVIDETSAGSPLGFPISDTSDDPMISGVSGQFGADGPAASGSLTFGISLTGGVLSLASGLQTADGDQAITLTQASGNTTTITGTYGAGLTAFTLVMGSDGKVTLTQYVPLEHSDDGSSGIEHNDTESPLTLSGLINATVIVKDGDGDTATNSVPIGDRIKIYDDGPDASYDGETRIGTVVLDETRDEGTDTPDGTAPDGLASATIDFGEKFAAADFGADGEGGVDDGGVGYELILSTDGIGSGLYALDGSDTATDDDDGYGQGDEITLSQDGNTITGSANGVDYFTLTIDPDTGVVTFNQLAAIWHPTIGDFDETATLTTKLADDIIVRQTVTDADGDTDSASINIGRGIFAIQDDGPDSFGEVCPEDVIAINTPGSSSGSLDLNLPDVGEDLPGVVSFGVADGDAVLDAEGEPITANGTALHYYVNSEGVLEARAGDETGDLVFTITLNGDGTYTYDQLLPITSVTTLNISNFDGPGGGNVGALAVNVADSPFDLIFSTKPGDSVNTNDDLIGVSGGQSVTVGEVVRVDFLEDVSVSGSGGGAVLNYGEYYTANGYRQDVVVLGNADTDANFTVKALIANDSGPGAADGDGTFYGDGNDSVVATTQLNIYAPGGTVPLNAAQLLAAGITVTNLGGGVWQVADLPTDYSFEITSTTAFNAVQIEGVDLPENTTDDFKLGGIELTTTVQTGVEFSVPIVLTDADGDPVTCDIHVVLGPPAGSPDVVAEVDEAGLPVIGSDSGASSEVVSGDLSTIVSGGSGTTSFAIQGDADGTVVTAYGTLVLNSDGTYTYTLHTPVNSDPDLNDGTNVEPAVDVFTYEMIQGGSVVGTGTISINIQDDVPTAKVDSDSMDVGDTSESGNVISGAGTIEGTANADIKGADSAEVTGVVGTLADGTDVDGRTYGDAGDTQLVVDGKWGSLTLNSDGSYTYNRTDGTPGGGTETFVYTLTDADGDVSSATLTITLPNSPPTITVTDQVPSDAADNQVYEKGLEARTGESEGSGEQLAAGADGDPSEATSGATMTFTSVDGVQSVVITLPDGVTTFTMTEAQLANLGTTPQVITGSYYTLTFTGYSYSAATGAGTINYLFDLTDNTLADPSSVAFGVKLIDDDGQSGTDTLTVKINDDAPDANDDADSMDVGDTSESGNVITGSGTAGGTSGAGVDLKGADSAEVTGVVGTLAVGTDVDSRTYGNVDTQLVVDGKWGALTLNSDGSYVYNRTAGTPGGGTETFVYTLTDADGDVSSATLTITLPDNAPTVSVTDLSVDEKGLPLGTGEQLDFNDVNRATNNTDSSEISSIGTMTISAIDGLQKVEVKDASNNWINVTGGTVGSPVIVNGTHGTIAVWQDGSGNFSYRYTLTSNYGTHPDTITSDSDGISGSADTLAGDSFAVRVTDGDNDQTSSTPAASAVINVTVLDDAPVIYSGPAALAIANSGTVSGTANFDFAIGADQRSSYSSSNSDFVLPVLTGTVGVTSTGTPINITSASVTWASENSSQAVFNFSFNYLANGVSTPASGTLTIDKATGSYTVDLLNPIQANTFPSIANASAPVGYHDGTSNPMASNPDVSVVRLNNGMYVQFSGYAESGSGTGNNNIKTSTDNVLSLPGDDEIFTDGEILVQGRDYVTITGLGGNGVHGDQMNKGEVIDFDIFNSVTNPTGFTNLTPNGQVESLFVMLDGIGSNEDLIMILKLYDTVLGTYTTKAVYVGNSDMFKPGDTDGGKYQGVVASLDGNDALIVIEQDDYNSAAQPTRFVIVGAQIISTDEDIAGVAIDLNGDVDLYNSSNVLIQDGDTLDTALTTISADSNDTGFKIKDIGFVTTTTTSQSASLNFATQLVDSEGDKSGTVNLAVTVSPVVLDTDHDGSVEYLSRDAGVRYDYDGDGISEATAWAAAGDSILVRDANGDGTVTDSSEFVFGGNGLTDLQALAAQYGSTLDANDADFAKFMVWNDANSNGAVDAGELTSLANAGIMSISLVSDGVKSAEAGGDVLVAGNSTFAYLNDNGEVTEGKVGDAAFVYGDMPSKLEERFAANLTNHGVVAAAVAAVGLMAASEGFGDIAASAPKLSLAIGDGVDLAAALVATDNGADQSRSLLDGESRVAANDDGADGSNSTSQVAEIQRLDVGDASDDEALSELLAGTELAADSADSTVDIAPAVVMAEAGGEPVQHNGVVEAVLADAVEGGEGGSVDALLAALPSGQGSADSLASPPSEGVPAWDNGHSGDFTPNVLQTITVEAIALHHDAVQSA